MSVEEKRKEFFELLHKVRKGKDIDVEDELWHEVCWKTRAIFGKLEKLERIEVNLKEVKKGEIVFKTLMDMYKSC